MVREFFRQHRSRLRGTWDLNLIAKKAAIDLPSEDAYRRIGDLFDDISNSQSD